MTMTSAVAVSAATQPPVPAREVDRIAAFMRSCSLEATRPNAADIAALAASMPRGTHVYLSAVPTRPATEQIAAAAGLREVGFEPVPHLAVRNFASLQALDEHLARLSGEAGARALLVIAGDRAEPAGFFRNAIEAIDSGLLQRHGIAEIGIAGYPDGHPRIPELQLDRALREKIGSAESTGLAVHVVTQFCFEPAPILAWIARLRDYGLEVPVRVGLAGPTNPATMVRYAARCGVRASAQSLARQAGLVRQLFAMTAPDALVRALADAHAAGRLGDVAPHFFSFGGVAATARWASAVAAGHIALDTQDGFRVEAR
jgi:methylenetetrahydrofolate reductase (NADPH)